MPPSLQPTGPEARRLYEDVVVRAMRHAAQRVDRAEAVEVAHEVACELLQRRLSGADDPDDERSFEGLVFRAVSNRLHNVRRAANRRDTAARVHHDERVRAPRAWGEPDRQLEVDELTRVIEATVAEMPPAMRETFLLVRHDGLSYSDAAERAGVGVGTVHTHLARASARLRDAIARYEGIACATDSVQPSAAVRTP
jgi:RNA polymerase sigma factor (sigma-70 family)